MMKSFEDLLMSSAEVHGHLCPGQAIGVRMAMLGCRLLGFHEPTRPDQIKKLIVYVEMDRCAADAVAHVTGVKLGRRSLKFADYGIMAATFLNLETGHAFRVLSTEESRDLATFYAPDIPGKADQQLMAYCRMPDSVLFRVQEVVVALSDADLPGPTRHKAVCNRCGQVIRDRREVMIDGLPWCRPCAQGAYFKEAKGVTWKNMSWSPGVSERFVARLSGPSKDRETRLPRTLTLQHPSSPSFRRSTEIF
jgi:formylmethanofuran dehydrogenase subunit E